MDRTDPQTPIEFLDIGILDRTVVRLKEQRRPMPKRKQPRDLRRYELVGELLAEMRRIAGLSQQDVAEAIGRPQSWMSTIESGQHRVDIVELVDLATVLDFDPAQVIYRLWRPSRKPSKRR